MSAPRRSPRSHPPRLPHLLRLAPLALVAALQACGGGGGGGTVEPPASVPVPAGDPLTVKGVAATGAALAGASVSAWCAIGTGTATSGADGTYSISIERAALPCVVEARKGDTVLHAPVPGTGGGSATAHLTPVTTMMLAHVGGQAPVVFAGAYAKQAASMASRITPAAVTAAGTAVAAILKDAGLDVAALGDPLAGALTAGSGTGYDGVLDALGASLARVGASADALAQAIAGASPVAVPSPVSPGGKANLLPVSLLLKPRAAACGALRSGRFHVVFVTAGHSGRADGLDRVHELATMDAAAADGPTWTWPDGAKTVMEPYPGQSCRYQTRGPNGLVQHFMVAPSGLVVARWTGPDKVVDLYPHLAIAVPEQTMPVSALAGTWNDVGWGRTTPGAWGWDGGAAVLTFDAGGAMTSLACPDEKPDTPLSGCKTVQRTGVTFTPNAIGGFDAPSGSGVRGFGFTAGNGMKLLVLYDDDGGVDFMTPARAHVPQSVGDAWSAWSLEVDVNGYARELPVFRAFSIVEADAAAGSVTRQATDPSSGAVVRETVVGNVVRQGWTRVGAGTAPVGARQELPTGLGITAYWSPNVKTSGLSGEVLGVSIVQP